MTRALAVALLLVALVALVAAWQWREATAAAAGRDAANSALRAAQQSLNQSNEARAEETRRADRLQEALNVAHTERQAVEASARRAVAADVSLRGELARLAARARAAAQDPAAADEREAAVAAVPVLTELLGRCNERRTELAQYADDARVAGKLCERAYDALRPSWSRCTTTSPADCS